jgi:hypothetical protein
LAARVSAGSWPKIIGFISIVFGLCALIGYGRIKTFVCLVVIGFVLLFGGMVLQTVAGCICVVLFLVLPVLALPFGLEAAICSTLLEFSAETCPIGIWKIFIPPARDYFHKLSAELSHSRVYGDNDSLVVLLLWIKKLAGVPLLDRESELISLLGI